MNLSLANTNEHRKSHLLMQAWSHRTRSSEKPASTQQLLDDLSPMVRKYCAWGTVDGVRSGASIERLGGVIEACLTSSGENKTDDRQFAGVVVGMMTQLGNGLRFRKKPSSEDGAFRAQDGRPVKYRVAVVPTRTEGDELCGWLAIGDWYAEAM